MLVTLDEVQAWLSESRLSLTEEDDLSEEKGISTFVKSTLATRYDTAAWTDEGDTPELVRQAISMLVAAIRIRKVYADQEDESAYAVRLEEWANSILMGILSGSLSLADDTPIDSTTSSVGFHPDDDTLDEESDTFHGKFQMGTKF